MDPTTGCRSHFVLAKREICFFFVVFVFPFSKLAWEQNCLQAQMGLATHVRLVVSPAKVKSLESLRHIMDGWPFVYGRQSPNPQDYWQISYNTQDGVTIILL